MYDPLIIGHRVRQLRLDRGLTVAELGTRIGRAASQVSVIENGRRDLRLAEIQRLAQALEVEPAELLSPEAPSPRAALEIALERAQRGPLYSSLGLPPLPARKTLSDEAISTILGLHDALTTVYTERAATPEEARRANTELRRTMRARSNHYPELEEVAAGLLRAIGHDGGPLTQRSTTDLAGHLGFSLHTVNDLPSSTRSVTDLANGRLYVSPALSPDADPRSVILQALAAHVLHHREPHNYDDFLRQRVEANYLAGALLIPEPGAVEFLGAAREARALSIEDLRDAFAVSYETAAHRFTNLASTHLDIPVHFLKVHSSGVVHKAYENDAVQFPTDALGAVEGQIVCRRWSARQVFGAEDRFSPYYQYTDKPAGTYWCTSQIQATSQGQFSISVGTDFAHSRWFRGRETEVRFASRCPDPQCCRTPPAELAQKWENNAFPSARLNSSLLATMPTEMFSGVDRPEVVAFLERHDPRETAPDSP
ncbi:helix-turn-helix transcriptional regulator [Mycetocola spongiae]|uniref:helix-turn-helix transcriptional regulator n=1 Tax=Mycetocola spongiae TaxID=2859226 RepID=UPI001CF5799D|nr:helix-turn-helix transcriptional regulator [Mycetocola spongiae]UCR89844.1 helix-turn-helix domain-containing protein [Mycetocola spongiae]